MRHSLILLSVICLVLAGTTSGSVKKGDLEVEAQGGWLMENTEKGCITNTGGILDYGDVISGATGTNLDSWFAGASLGFFTSKNFQVAVTGFYSQMDGDAETFEFTAETDAPAPQAEFDLDMDVYGIGGRARWHFFPGKSLVPYVGAQVLWAKADIDVEARPAPGYEAFFTTETKSNDENGLLWGPIVGLRLELAKRLDFIVEYQYHLWSGGISDIIDDGHAISAGLSLKLK